MKYCPKCRANYPTDFQVCPKDQAVLQVASELQPGMILRNKYIILNKIGSGGMATVYRAQHKAFDEVRAIKVVSSELANNQEFLTRFRTEARITRRLKHPNAVHVEDLDATEDGLPFIVMEYVQGRDLRSVIEQTGPLPVPRTLNIAMQVAGALSAAHQMGITHRDIKPDNILLTTNGDGSDLAKVLDFGIAKAREGTITAVNTRDGVLVGTPQYMSPEQAEGKHGDEIDGRSDLYSLGVVLYELITARLPFDSDTPMGFLLKHLSSRPIPPDQLRPELKIPQSVSQLVMKAMEKNPDRRFSSAEAMQAGLQDPEAWWAREQDIAATLVSPLPAPAMAPTVVISPAAVAAAAAAPAPAPQPVSPPPPPRIADARPAAARVRYTPPVELDPPEPATVMPASAAAPEASSRVLIPQPLAPVVPVELIPASSRSVPADKNWKVPGLAGIVVLVMLVLGAVYWRSHSPQPVQHTDQEIQEAVTNALINLHRPTVICFGVGCGGHVIVKDGSVTLVGTVVSEADRLIAGETARKVPGVKEVINEMPIWPQATYTDSSGTVQSTNITNWPFEAPQPTPMPVVDQKQSPPAPTPKPQPPKEDRAHQRAQQLVVAGNQQLKSGQDAAASGSLQEALAQDAAAISSFRQVLALDPNNRAAKKGLQAALAQNTKHTILNRH